MRLSGSAHPPSLGLCLQGLSPHRHQLPAPLSVTRSRGGCCPRNSRSGRARLEVQAPPSVLARVCPRLAAPTSPRQAGEAERRARGAATGRALALGAQALGAWISWAGVRPCACIPNGGAQQGRRGGSPRNPKRLSGAHCSWLVAPSLALAPLRNFKPRIPGSSGLRGRQLSILTNVVLFAAEIATGNRCSRRQGSTGLSFLLGLQAVEARLAFEGPQWRNCNLGYCAHLGRKLPCG